VESSIKNSVVEVLKSSAREKGLNPNSGEGGVGYVK
jgi:hypothetical protein